MKLLGLGILGLILFAACETVKNDNSPCEEKMCTMEFRSVVVKYTDAAGKPLVVRDFKSVNQRTKRVLNNDVVTDTVYAKGVYMVATDANLNDLSEGGDTVLVSAKHPTTNAVRENKFVVSGGRCNCHIAKLSGPEVVVF